LPQQGELLRRRGVACKYPDDDRTSPHLAGRGKLTSKTRDSSEEKGDFVTSEEELYEERENLRRVANLILGGRHS